VESDDVVALALYFMQNTQLSGISVQEALHVK
jgi:hypothetical protein